MQFREYFIASLFAIPRNELAQAEAIIALNSAQFSQKFLFVLKNLIRSTKMLPNSIQN